MVRHHANARPASFAEGCFEMYPPVSSVLPLHLCVRSWYTAHFWEKRGTLFFMLRIVDSRTTTRVILFRDEKVFRSSCDYDNGVASKAILSCQFLADCKRKWLTQYGNSVAVFQGVTSRVLGSSVV